MSLVNVVTYAAPGAGSLPLDVQTRALERWLTDKPPEICAAAIIEQAEMVVEPIRPGLLDVLDVVRAGDAGAVLVAELGVIAPGVAGQEAYRAEVARAGGQLLAVREVAPSPHRLLLAEYEQLRDQYDREWARRRLAAGRRRKATDEPETHQGGRAPFGRLLTSAGEILDDAREMSTVIRVGELRRGGSSFSDIAAILTAEGRKTKEGLTTWHREQVRRIWTRHYAAGDGSEPVEQDESAPVR